MFVGKHTKATRAKMRARALERWADPVFHETTTAALGAAQRRKDARENHRQGALRYYRERPPKPPKTEEDKLADKVRSLKRQLEATEAKLRTKK